MGADDGVPCWHPVTWLSHMLDVTLFGADAGRAHITNSCRMAAPCVFDCSAA